MYEAPEFVRWAGEDIIADARARVTHTSHTEI